MCQRLVQSSSLSVIQTETENARKSKKPHTHLSVIAGSQPWLSGVFKIRFVILRKAAQTKLLKGKDLKLSMSLCVIMDTFKNSNLTQLFLSNIFNVYVFR